MKNKEKLVPVRNIWPSILHICLILWIILCLTLWVSKTAAQGTKYFQTNAKTAPIETIILSVDNWLNQHFWSHL